MGQKSTHFDNGLTNRSSGLSVLESLLTMPDPTKMHMYFNDFDHFTAADWTITRIDGGTDSAQVNALTNADGGVLLVTTNDADDDQESFQKVGESFKFESGKDLIFKARLKLSDATQSDMTIGLQITDTTPLAVSDGVFFQKDDGDANLDLHIVKNSTATDVTAISTLEDDTYVEVGFVYDSRKDEIRYYVDGTMKGTAVTTNLVDDEELTVSFSVKAGTTAAKSLYIDYILVAKDR